MGVALAVAVVGVVFRGLRATVERWCRCVDVVERSGCGYGGGCGLWAVVCSREWEMWL